jgi:hypothetical protein
VDKRKVLPVVLVASIAGEALLPQRHSHTLAPQPQPHTEVETTVPFANTTSPVSASGGAGHITDFELNQD